MHAFPIAFQALAANKLRAGLTMLGTIIGVGSVVMVWSVGMSHRQYFREGLGSLGDNMLIVRPRFNAEDEDQRRYRYRPLHLSDMDALRQFCPSLEELSPRLVRWGAKIVYGAGNQRTDVIGCLPAMLKIRKWTVENGVPIGDADVQASSRVVLLGSKVAMELFGEQDPVGRIVRIERQPFKVIGVLQEKGYLFGDDQDNIVVAPYTSVADHLGGGRDVEAIFATAHNRELSAQAKGELLTAIRAVQKIPPGRRDAFEVFDFGELASTIDQQIKGFAIFIGVVGGISLLVGGIGIMNIMLVAVTERTREIGLRIALGATDSAIVMQFLVEAVVLNAIGGLIGLAGGIGLAYGAVRALSYMERRTWPFVLSPGSLVLAFSFAVGVGFFFGIYPAWRASRLNPIEALRTA